MSVDQVRQQQEGGRSAVVFAKADDSQHLQAAVEVSCSVVLGVAYVLLGLKMMVVEEDQALLQSALVQEVAYLYAHTQRTADRCR